MIRVLVLYAVSGFISLGYQVAWFRIVTDWFGSTSLTFALVVGNFIGGLGLGALLSARVTRFASDRLNLDDPLRIYGLFELLIALTAMLTIAGFYLPGDLLGSFPYTNQDGIWFPSLPYKSLATLTAALSIFLPCFFMGMTFPLLCDTFVHTPKGATFPSLLYAMNTLGACIGILVCQFSLILWFGHTRTFMLMIGANLALGAYFLSTGGAPSRWNAAGPSADTETKTERHSRPAASGWTLLVLATLSGFIAGALEGDLFKRVSFMTGAAPGATMTFVSFWAVLGIFVASAAVKRFPRLRLTDIKLAFVVALIWYMVAWYYRYQILSGLEDPNPPTWFPSSMLILFGFTAVYTLVPYTLISTLLPYICNRMQADKLHLGIAYGLNTVAFCGGLIIFSLAAPSRSIFYSLNLFPLFFLIGTATLLAIRNLEKSARWQASAGIAALAGALILTPNQFDPDVFYPNEAQRHLPVEAVMANASDTTFVVDFTSVRAEPEKMLYFGNHKMSGTNKPAQTYMRLMAHVPLLAQKDPRKALLICFGVGNTASAIASHQAIETIDIVDRNSNVFLTAPVFNRWNKNVINDPRLRLINDDGRAYLRKTDEKYDLITSEPPPPMASGVYRLYSLDYYLDAIEHLTPSGMMSQWLPIYQLPQEAADLIIRTFVAAFPHTILIIGYQFSNASELILVGSRLPIDMETVISRMREDESVEADLAEIDIERDNDLRFRLVADDEELRRVYSSGRVLRDQYNDLEHLILNPNNTARYAGASRKNKRRFRRNQKEAVQ